MIKVIESNGRWVIEENECVYGEYGEMVGKKMDLNENVAGTEA